MIGKKKPEQPAAPAINLEAEAKSLKAKLEQAQAELASVKAMVKTLGDAKDLKDRADAAEHHLADAKHRIAEVHAALMHADTTYFAELQGRYNTLPSLKAIADKLKL